MTAHCRTCTCPPEPEPLVSPAAVAVLMSRGWTAQDARETVLGWYDDEDRLGYEAGHVCCPDCGCDPEDHTCHADGCRRILPAGDPLEYLQSGPPWQPWLAEVPA